MRVAVTRFDLPSFHVRGPDGALLGPEIEMAQQARDVVIAEPARKPDTVVMGYCACKEQRGQD